MELLFSNFCLEALISFAKRYISVLISMHILISYHRNISCLGVDDIAEVKNNLHQMAAGYEKKDFEHKKGI
jgi:uncharacterized membrane protein